MYNNQFPPEYRQPDQYQQHPSDWRDNKMSKMPHQHEKIISAPQSAPKNQLKFVAYGTKTAFQFDPSETTKGAQTVMIESAAKIGGGGSELDYDWKKKIQFQITLSELPFLIGVLFGFLPEVRFDMHGTAKKWFEVENQGGKFFFKCGQEGKLNVMPVPLPEASSFGLLALNQYTANFPLLTSDSVLQSVQAICNMAFQNASFKRIQRRP